MTIHCIVGQRMHARCSLCGALASGSRRDGTGRDDTDRHIRKREDTHAGRDAFDPGSIAISGAVAGEKREEQPGERTDQYSPSQCLAMDRLGRIFMRP